MNVLYEKLNRNNFGIGAECSAEKALRKLWERDYTDECRVYQLKLSEILRRTLTLAPEGGVAEVWEFGQCVRVRMNSIENVFQKHALTLWSYLPDAVRVTKEHVSGNIVHHAIFTTAEDLVDYVGTTGVIRPYGRRDESEDVGADDDAVGADDDVPTPGCVISHLPVYKVGERFVPFHDYDNEAIVGVLRDKSRLKEGDDVHAFRRASGSEYLSAGVVVRVDALHRTCHIRFRDAPFDVDTIKNMRNTVVSTSKWKKHGVRSGGGKRGRSDAYDVDVVRWRDVKNPSLIWNETEEDCIAAGSPFRPVKIVRSGTLVFALRRIVIKRKEYLVVIVPNPHGALHTLTTIPVNEEPMGVPIRGDVGVIPAKNAALLTPYLLPSLVYTQRADMMPSAIRFTSRVCVTNGRGHIVGTIGNWTMPLSEEEERGVRELESGGGGGG